jgi:phosphatidylglycerophosphate synthase
MNKEINTTKSNIDQFDFGKSLKQAPAGKDFPNNIIKVERYINRPLASLIVRAVFNTRITPNGLTYFSFFLGLAGAFLFSRGEYLYFLLGGVAVQLASIIDCADGMLARAKDMCSDFGSHLDLLLDRISDFVIMVGISAGCYFFYQDIILLLLGLFAAGLYQLQIQLYYLTSSFLQVKEKGQSGEARALLFILLLIFSIANRLDIFLMGLLALTAIVNVTRLFYFITLGRKKV